MFDRDTLVFTKENNLMKVEISSSGYERERLDVIRDYCPVEIQQEEGTLYLDYVIPPYFKTVKEESARLKTDLERLSLAQKMTALHFDCRDFRIPYLHPENIIVSGGRVTLLHQGIEKLLAPREQNADFYLASYKALLVSILLPKVDFELAIDGLEAVKDKTAQEIAALATLEEVNDYISDKYSKLSQESAAKNILVDKNKWKALLIGVSILSVLTVGLGYATYQSMFRDGPLKSAVINAQANFMRKDYSETVEGLKSYSAEALPKEAKYILAASFVRLDSLSEKQKETVLNTITYSTDDTILNYWIYLGRGNFEKALDLAQNIGDNQLILHAYTNLYESVKANVHMNGEEKQKKLEEYEKKIKELSSEVGEVTQTSSSSTEEAAKGNGEQ